MPVARIKNSRGQLLIDQNFFSLGLTSRGTVVTPAKNNGAALSFVSVTLPHSQGILAFTAPEFTALWYTSYGQGTVTHTFASPYVGVQIEYFLFDLPELATVNPNHAKLILRNPDTRRTIFDSRIPYVRAVEALNFSVVFGDGSPSQYDYNYPGKKLAIVQCKRAVLTEVEVVPDDPTRPLIVAAYGSSFAKAAGGQASVVKMNNYAAQNYRGGTVPQRTASLDGAYLIIDVTNY